MENIKLDSVILSVEHGAAQSYRPEMEKSESLLSIALQHHEPSHKGYIYESILSFAEYHMSMIVSQVMDG